MLKSFSIQIDFSGIKKSFAAILAVLFCFLLVTGSAGAENSSEEIADKIESEQRNLESAREELAAIDNRLANAEVYLNQRRLDLSDANYRLRIAEDNYNRSLIQYEDRISAIYKLGDTQFYEIMLNSQDFSDAVSRISFLGKVSESDKRLVLRVRSEAATVRLARESVDNIKQNQAGDINDLKLRRKELEIQLASGKSSIDRQLAELSQARSREQEAELRRIVEESAMVDNSSIYGGVMGPSVIVSSQPPAGLQPTGIAISGIASWYGPGFQGNSTANGEIYNMHGFTAAHKSLPFNTWLKVTHNGRSVFVRINDRGPYVGGRIIDLSYSSAQAIGISGIGMVRAEIYG